MSAGSKDRDEPMLDPIDRPRPGEKGDQRPSASKPPELDPDVNNPDATPGTGVLPDPSEDDPNVQPSS
jgi:hypothetical protein